jgi:hypothetical protein
MIRSLTRRTRRSAPVAQPFIVCHCAKPSNIPTQTPIELAASLLDLDAQKEKLLGDEAMLKALFGEMLHMCLWGNATVRTPSSPLTQVNSHYNE